MPVFGLYMCACKKEGDFLVKAKKIPFLLCLSDSVYLNLRLYYIAFILLCLLNNTLILY